MTRALVSVVIPAYNAGSFIEEALQSVLGQTYSNLEVIVVDDGSTDDTRERVTALGKRVTLISQPNGGSGVARNTGIRSCTGAYVAFLDADDVWLPRKVARLVDVLEQDLEAGAAYHGAAATNEQGVIIGQPVTPLHDGDVLEPLLLRCFFGPPMVMIRRACLHHVGLFDPSLRLGEDWDLFLRIALAGYRVRCVPAVLVHCRIHRTNKTRDLRNEAALTRTVLDRVFSDSRLPTRLRSSTFRTKAYRTHAIFMATRCLREDLWPDGLALLRDAVTLDPRVLSRPSFYLDIALRTLPLADQTWPALARHADQATTILTKSLDGLLALDNLPAEVLQRKHQAWSALWITISAIQAFAHRFSSATTTFGRACLTDPITVAAAVARAGTGRWLSIPSTWRPARAGTAEQS